MRNKVIIYKQDAIDAVADGLKRVFVENRDVAEILLKNVPSAQPERTVYENMSDEQFEEWLYEHGICHPDIHESIPCSAVPLLIDNAINELLPQEHEIILCKDCKHRPTRDEDGWLDFPTERCPCQNGDDFYYSWMPDDNWFCGNAERREE